MSSAEIAVELGEELEEFRDNVRRFVRSEIEPHTDAWEKAGIVPLDAWRQMGEAGLLCVDVPEQYGGAGADVRFSTVVIDELARVNAGGFVCSVMVHSDIVAPYIVNHGTDAQKSEWLPRLVSGEVVGAIAMTEPAAGSDLQAMRTQALRDDESFLLNGQKTFITNGQNAGLVVLAAKTDPREGARGISLFLVDAGRQGYSPGRNLQKVGMHMADTSEIFLENVRVPAAAMLGEEGAGFGILMGELPRERLVIGVYAVSAAEAAIEWTVEYVLERQAFGQRIADFQNTRFRMAELVADAKVGRAFVDQCVAELARGTLDTTTASIAKLWGTELQTRVTDACLQMFGGYGYMSEYPIARAWADARVQRIYGGANEIMKELIARSVFGRPD